MLEGVQMKHKGYQPEKGNLNKTNPPKNGSGVPNNATHSVSFGRAINKIIETGCRNIHCRDCPLTDKMGLLCLSTMIYVMLSVNLQ